MWFWLALASGVASAVSVVYNKKLLQKVHAPLLAWSLFALPIPLLLGLSLISGLPAVNAKFFWSIAGSSLIYTLGKTLNLSVLSKRDLSQIYPLISFGVLYIYVFGLIFLNEALNLTGLIGIILIIAGAYLFQTEQAREDILQPFKILFSDSKYRLFLVSSFLMSITAIFDKTAILNTTPKNPIFTLTLENILMSLLLSGYMTHRDRFWLREIKSNFFSLLTAALIFTTLAILVMSGFSNGPIALVVGVKKLELVFMLILGKIFLKDHARKNVWLGTMVMLLGVVVIKIA